MGKNNYSEKLKDPRWQKKRLKILERDKWTCQSCFDTENTLHVHHMKYVYGLEPWEIEDQFLITLCASCHEEETNTIRTLEDNLLNAIRTKRFLGSQVIDLTYAFSELELQEPQEVTASIIKFALTEYFNEIRVAFWARLHAEYTENL